MINDLKYAAGSYYGQGRIEVNGRTITVQTEIMTGEKSVTINAEIPEPKACVCAECSATHPAVVGDSTPVAGNKATVKEALAYWHVMAALEESTFAAVRNEFGRMSILESAFSSGDEPWQIWWHMTRDTVAVSASSMQAPRAHASDPIAAMAAVIHNSDPDDIAERAQTFETEVEASLRLLGNA